MRPQRYFSPTDAEPSTSLAISGGRGGARLTHSHERQYSYVLQSLSLWREINTDMFKLWCLAEADLLSEHNTYRLVNTGAFLSLENFVTYLLHRPPGSPGGCSDVCSGLPRIVHQCRGLQCAFRLDSSVPYTLYAGQGMNRVQQAPHISKAIHNILWRCQQQIGSWVGSSVSD